MNDFYENIQEEVYDLRPGIKAPLTALGCCLFVLVVLWFAVNIVAYHTPSLFQYKESVRNRIFIGTAHLIIGACLGTALLLVSLRLKGLNRRWRYRLIILVIVGCLFVSAGYALEQFLVRPGYIAFDNLRSFNVNIVPILKAYNTERMVFRLIGGGQLMLCLSGLILFIHLKNRIIKQGEPRSRTWATVLFVASFCLFAAVSIVRGMHLDKLGLKFIHIYWVSPPVQNLSLYCMAGALFFLYYLAVEREMLPGFPLFIPVAFLIVCAIDQLCSFYNAYRIYDWAEMIVRFAGYGSMSPSDLKYAFAGSNHLIYDGYLTRIPLSYGLYFLPLWFYSRMNRELL
ncbi:MAG: hypothetical protein E3J72_20550 [Planctomycetota bacterium]|nr:MAG: hypothetical protein E3J72_20550 [Planctomycetota bacterium]